MERPLCQRQRTTGGSWRSYSSLAVEKCPQAMQLGLVDPCRGQVCDCGVEHLAVADTGCELGTVDLDWHVVIQAIVYLYRGHFAHYSSLRTL